MAVEWLSYSSMTQLLRNPLIFKMKEILGIYDTKMSVSGMIGRAAHQALRFYYGGDPDRPVPADRAEAIGIARQVGLDYLDTFDDAYITYGKTGSRESMLKGYAQTMDIYFSEEPEYHEILACEERMKAEIKTLEGEILPLPAVAVPDLVHQRKDGGVEIIDHKFVTSFTDTESEDYIKIVQSMFLFHLLIAAKGIRAERMIFREVKRTKNTDGSPQIRDYVIPFDHEPYRIIFYNLYKDVVKFISNPDAIYLPNISDMLDGEHAGMLYAQGLISADMSDVEVMHKVRDLAFVSKKFVASRLDRVENEHLLPEEKIKMRLAEFGVPVVPVETVVGATVTQYRFKVSAGVRMSTILKHKADIAGALGAKGVVIHAPIAGTQLVGVEVENAVRGSVKLSASIMKIGTLSIPVGVDVHGESVSFPLNEMPHLLIAGSTGSGKSVLLHSIITALKSQMAPEQMKLVLIDPKRVELAKFGKLPHLDGSKILYEYEDVVRALMGLTDEMERRYRVLEKAAKRDIDEFNASKRDASKKLPYIVAIVDEFADLMTRAKMEETKKPKAYSSRSKPWLYKEIEKRLGADMLEKHYGRTKQELAEVLENLDAEDEMKRPDANVELLIVRLAQMARAVGIHLVIATQRPSVDVITGLIKANFPTRIALTTSSPADSVVILGQIGAEKLAGKGDMLFQSPALRGLVRLQGYHL